MMQLTAFLEILSLDEVVAFEVVPPWLWQY